MTVKQHPMKKLCSTILVIYISLYSFGQNNEFKIYDNGLIYDTTTMERLGMIVDSLNLEFKTCDLAHPYYSQEQGLAIVVDIPSNKAKNLIHNNASIEDYKRQYPKAVLDENVWIIKFRYTNYQDNDVIEYSGLPEGYGSAYSITLKYKSKNDKNNGWVIDQENYRAFYLKGLRSTEIPNEYARYVQYVDCMIDTTAQVFFPSAETQAYQQVEENSNADDFVKWARQFPGRPLHEDYEHHGDDAYKLFSNAIQTWDSLRLIDLDKRMQQNVYWYDKLLKAKDEAINDGNSDETIEFYVARYISKADALTMKRSRRVMGGCSMDLSPRYHAMKISTLAAETAQWDIFLRSHLDVMNDRFERRSDGSYAWEERRTYLRELEELDINAIDLLLGISLRVKNTSDNHYQGSISRVGRALTDARNRNEVEKRLLKMIDDGNLDPYNRVLFAYLYANYAHNLDSQPLKEQKMKRLKTTIGNWPEYMKKIWSEG